MFDHSKWCLTFLKMKMVIHTITPKPSAEPYQRQAFQDRVSRWTIFFACTYRTASATSATGDRCSECSVAFACESSQCLFPTQVNQIKLVKRGGPSHPTVAGIHGSLNPFWLQVCEESTPSEETASMSNDSYKCWPSDTDTCRMCFFVQHTPPLRLREALQDLTDQPVRQRKTHAHETCLDSSSLRHLHQTRDSSSLLKGRKNASQVERPVMLLEPEDRGRFRVGPLAPLLCGSAPPTDPSFPAMKVN